MHHEGHHVSTTLPLGPSWGLQSCRKIPQNVSNNEHPQVMEDSERLRTVNSHTFCSCWSWGKFLKMAKGWHFYSSTSKKFVELGDVFGPCFFFNVWSLDSSMVWAFSDLRFWWRWFQVPCTYKRCGFPKNTVRPPSTLTKGETVVEGRMGCCWVSPLVVWSSKVQGYV